MDENQILVVNGLKGLWTVETVIKLLQESGVKFKISLGIKEDFLVEENGHKE